MTDEPLTEAGHELVVDRINILIEAFRKACDLLDERVGRFAIFGVKHPTNKDEGHQPFRCEITDPVEFVEKMARHQKLGGRYIYYLNFHLSSGRQTTHSRTLLEFETDEEL